MKIIPQDTVYSNYCILVFSLESCCHYAAFSVILLSQKTMSFEIFSTCLSLSSAVLFLMRLCILSIAVLNYSVIHLLHFLPDQTKYQS